ncbi:21723_t:CDS:2 [Cetraspora pellucida]|uniref:21723_t:CDS:1 n=1 Tax=Cetraspora pellucida TaxID=1433469 RepID=A0A9N9N835_9GLOM|nr:21723_t:CDS:2 [Cetraspora pellucida]
MCILSEKFARIEPPINRFGSHLNSQGVTVNEDLARHNFEFADKCLCEIWKHNKIHEKQAFAHNDNSKLLIESTNNTSSTQLIFSLKSIKLYLTVKEVITLLDHLDTQQIKLSNTAFLENFLNLSSIGLSHKLETSYLLETLSDIE